MTKKKTKLLHIKRSIQKDVETEVIKRTVEDTRGIQKILDAYKKAVVSYNAEYLKNTKKIKYLYDQNRTAKNKVIRKFNEVTRKNLQKKNEKLKTTLIKATSDLDTKTIYKSRKITNRENPNFVTTTITEHVKGFDPDKKYKTKLRLIFKNVGDYITVSGKGSASDGSILVPYFSMELEAGIPFNATDVYEYWLKKEVILVQVVKSHSKLN